MVSEYKVIVMSSSLCENTAGFRCFLYRVTQSFPSGSQSGSAKLTASLKLIWALAESVDLDSLHG